VSDSAAVSAAAQEAGSVAVTEAARRRTFAVISHPDAGKSTLTEALALHARVINEAGHIHGKAGRRSTVSDWMDIEKARGISISSAALQFAYGPAGREAVVNLVDTPGHADFSEDTYRVLAAVDSAVMLIDAAKGMEPQTLKLFEVCRYRRIPVLTVINKWDRPGHEPLALMDEVLAKTGLQPTPLTWPVGIAGDFRGVLDRRTGQFVQFTRTAGGATLAVEKKMTPAEALAAHGEAWLAAVEESDLLTADGADHSQDGYLAHETTPVLFGSAVLNFGISHLLDTLLELAPPPGAREDESGKPRPVGAPFSGFVFKIQAGMDSAHRDRLAYIRVCSGVFERGAVVTHAATKKPFATKYAQQVFGRERETVDFAYPGDVVGLVNASSLRVGDSLYVDEHVCFPAIPSFAPEHFAVARAVDSGRYKQFRRGIEQLEQEGVVQVLRSDLRGDQAPVLAAVGPMQFEVAVHRMKGEMGAEILLDRLPYSLARRTTREWVVELDRQSGVEVLQRGDGEWLAVFADPWRLGRTQRDFPEAVLEPLVASADL